MSVTGDAQPEPEDTSESTLPRHVTWPAGVEYPEQLELRDKTGGILAYYDLRREGDEASARWQMRAANVGSGPSDRHLKTDVVGVDWSR